MHNSSKAGQVHPLGKMYPENRNEHNFDETSSLLTGCNDNAVPAGICVTLNDLNFLPVFLTVNVCLGEHLGPLPPSG